MQFRETDGTVQCIRSTYDPAKKRCVQKMVASLPRWSDTYPSDERLAALTDDERAAYRTKWETQQARKRDETLRYTVQSAPQWIARITEALGKCEIHDDIARETWEAMAALAKALRKSGHRKPARKPKPTPAVSDHAPTLPGVDVVDPAAHNVPIVAP